MINLLLNTQYPWLGKNTANKKSYLKIGNIMSDVKPFGSISAILIMAFIWQDRGVSF